VPDLRHQLEHYIWSFLRAFEPTKTLVWRRCRTLQKSKSVKQFTQNSCHAHEGRFQFLLQELQFWDQGFPSIHEWSIWISAERKVQAIPKYTRKPLHLDGSSCSRSRPSAVTLSSPHPLARFFCLYLTLSLTFSVYFVFALVSKALSLCLSLCLVPSSPTPLSRHIMAQLTNNRAISLYDLYDGQFPCPSETLFVRQFCPPLFLLRPHITAQLTNNRATSFRDSCLGRCPYPWEPLFCPTVFCR